MEREQRHKVIMRTIDRPGVTTVEALVELTGVAPVTIRRDLDYLERHGMLTRTHGGAKRVAKRGTPKPFQMRRMEDEAAKLAIAKAAAHLISDDESIIIDNGTTCYAVAAQLSGRPLTALCLSLHAAARLGQRPGPRILIPGGTVENDTLAMSGNAAAEAMRNFAADAVILGSCSTSVEYGLATTTYEDAENKRVAMAAAQRRILVVAPRKLDHVSTFRFGEVADLHQLVTTNDAPRDVLRDIRALEVEVVTVSVE